MQDSNPSAQSQSTAPNPTKIDEERKKLDEELEKGNITQAEYFQKIQNLTGGTAAASQPSASTPPQAQQQTPPQLPPASSPGIKPVTPIAPITPGAPQQAGPKEEIPPIGQALAVGSEDVEVVECYKCGGLITVTTPQRPVIIACPNCGTKGEVTSEEELMASEQETPAAPKASEGVEIDEKKIFKFGEDQAEDKPKGPSFGASLDSDLAKQEVVDKNRATPTPNKPASTTSTTTSQAPTPTTTTPSTPTPKPKPKSETENK